jgi:outer membrane protein assembly factor BamB
MNSDSKIYAINLPTGQTQWKQQISRSIGVKSTGIGNTFFITNDSLKILRVNTLTGSIQEVFKLTNSVVNAVSTLDAPIPIIDHQTQDTLLLSTWSYGFYQNAFSATYLLLYNLTQKRIVYNLLQREGVASGTNGFLFPDRLPTVYNNKVYVAIGKSIQCNDLMTGKLLWQNRNFDGDFSLSGLLVEKDKLYGCATSDSLFCLNTSDGNILWKTPTGGSSTGLLYLNGIIYLASSGDGKLYAIDANTGAYIWQIRSPDYESSNKQSFFTDNVATDGKNIFVRSYLNLYCYKAAR